MWLAISNNMLIFAKEDCMSDSMETPRKPVLTAKEKEKAEKYSKRMELTLNLANLGSILQNTFTAGNRVLDILDEQPVTKDVTGCESIEFKGAAAGCCLFWISICSESIRNQRNNSCGKGLKNLLYSDNGNWCVSFYFYRSTDN